MSEFYSPSWAVSAHGRATSHYTALAAFSRTWEATPQSPQCGLDCYTLLMYQRLLDSY